MPSYWDSLLQLITNGEAVNAGVTNRPLEQLSRRTQYLKDILQALRAGEALLLYDQPLDSATTWVGSPVYYDPVALNFKGAQAIINFTPGENYGYPGPQADVRGIVIDKSTSTKGTLLMAGFWRTSDITAVITGAVAGDLYLSPSAPGKLVQGGVIGKMKVGYYDGTNVFFDPFLVATLNEHVHLRYDLVTDPASSNLGAAKLVLALGKYTIASADSSLPGWLPASDPVFGGLAPAGSKFGYNLSQHPELLTNWPPQPYNGYSLELTGSAPPNCDIIPQDVAVVDANGLWWMDDCATQCPWSHPYPDTAVSDPYCTHLRRMVLWFTKFSHLTDNMLVRSLQPCSGSPVQIEVRDCATGLPSTTGNLCLYLESILAYDPTNPTDPSVALKEIVGSSYRLGSVASSIKATSPLLVTSGVPLGEGKYSGDITLAVSNTAGILDSIPELQAMDNTREEIIQDIPYLEFPAGRGSACVYKITLPDSLGNVNVLLKVLMLCSSVGSSSPNLSVTYRRVAMPTGVSSLATTEQTVSGGLQWPFGTVSLANQIAVISTATIQATSGDIVTFKVERSASDSYAGEIGLLKVRFITTPR